MVDAVKYSAKERLSDGRRLEIRALRPEDKANMLAAIERTSAKSLYRRFFGIKRDFSEKELAFFLDIDFVNHVALVAIVEEDSRPIIVGGGRYITQKPGAAEVAFVVVDDYQGKGIGTALLRHLAIIARHAGLKELVAEVLPENTPMLKVFQNSELKLTTNEQLGVVHVALQL